MKKLRFLIRDYFGFNRTETNGFLILWFIMIVALLTPSLASQFFKKPSSAIQPVVLDSLAYLLESPPPKQLSTIVDESTLTFFNPNEISAAEWQALGVSARISNRIRNYIEKGGKFRKKEDVLNIYDFPPETYQVLAPYIVIPEKKPAFKRDNKKRFYKRDKAQKRYTKKKRIIVPFELNQADTTQLKQISGIGTKLSARIVAYRNKLGGFVTWQQLHEVYGLAPEVITTLQKHAHIATDEINKVAINQADDVALSKHPYISKKLAKVIVSYRMQHGRYESEEDLSKIKLIDQRKLIQLREYISYE
ncbi:MAG: ComEA family DNA-binding protein [Thermonemataceae bacterium]